MEKRMRTTYDSDEIVLFASSYFGIRAEKIKLDASLFHDLGVDGDDAVEFLNAFAERFSVDLDCLKLHEFFGPEASPSPVSLLLFASSVRSRTAIRRLELQHLIKAAEVGKFEFEEI